VPLLVLALIPLALVISLPLTAVVIRAGHRLGTFDSPGVPGQVKLERRRVPNTGGIAVFWAITLPVAAGVLAVYLGDLSRTFPALEPHLVGIRQQGPLAVLLIVSLAVMHSLGVIDDRRPMGPWLKLAVMVLPAAAVALSGVLMPDWFPDTRLLTLVDSRVGGAWLSIALTVLWFLVVTNAMNFMDNMDGLSAGVATTAAACFLAATLVSPRPQWFIAAMLALLIGACVGFLAFNFPRRGGARVYMGDGGSLVLGFLLAFLTTRTTYADMPGPGGTPAPALHAHWHAVFMPLVVLAVPLYDFVSVVIIRLSQGRSPFVGDTQHLSHRLTRLGLSRRAAVLVIYALTGATGISGIVLGSLRPWQAVMVAVQVVLILAALALFEYARVRESRRGETRSGAALAAEATR
jgi:UDP-GlcNAc:undecaprenyl-phosphate GlcNAc-1-phosphate transferase